MTLNYKLSAHSYLYALVKRCLMQAACLLLVVTIYSPKAKADVSQDVIGLLSQISCHTQELGSMVNGRWGNTCMTNSLSDMATGILLNPAAMIYIEAMMLTTINNTTLFPGSDGTGSCSRTNRADPNNPTLDFGFCMDVMLQPMMIAASVKASISVVSALAQKTNVWTAIKSALTLNPSTYNITHNDGPGTWGFYMNFGLDGPSGIPVIYNIDTKDDQICLFVPGMLGKITIGCKYIAEPHAVSTYASLMNGGSNEATDCTNNPSSPSCVANQFLTCSGSNTCFSDASNNSKAFLPISGPLINCISEMLSKVLVSPTVCDPNNPSAYSPSAFFQFQARMSHIVTSLLTLYIILFGIKIVLAQGEMKQEDIVMHLVKFILVSYFAIGINMGNTRDIGFDGMTQWIFPLMFNGAAELASWIMSAGGSGGLCHFQQSEYVAGYEHLALWDALDCRLAHYLGIDEVADAASRGNSTNTNHDGLNYSIPPYVFFIIPAIMMGNFALAMLVIMYPILIISIAAYMVNAFVVCMIGVTILGFLAPLFVPFALFEFTKGYFDAWAKLMLSFVLQPMVVATFMVTLFTVYDLGFYNQCKYDAYTIENSVTDVNGAVIAQSKTLFALDTRADQYVGGETGAAYTNCTNSLGYMINSVFGVTATSSSTPPFGTVVTPGQSAKNLFGLYPILSKITSTAGLFFSSPSVAFLDILDFMISVLTACFCLYLMYHLSSQISSFAADMVEGVSVGSAAINPQSVMKGAQAGMKALSKAKRGGAGKESADNKKDRPDGGSAKDSASGGDDDKKSSDDSAGGGDKKSADDSAGGG